MKPKQYDKNFKRSI